MALKTSEDYVARLKKMKPNVYAHGKKIGRDDPMLELPINTLRFTFDAVNDPELKDLLITKSHLTGETINRFTALNLSIEDLYTQQEMKRKCYLTMYWFPGSGFSCAENGNLPADWP